VPGGRLGHTPAATSPQSPLRGSPEGVSAETPFVYKARLVAGVEAYAGVPPSSRRFRPPIKNRPASPDRSTMKTGIRFAVRCVLLAVCAGCGEADPVAVHQPPESDPPSTADGNASRKDAPHEETNRPLFEGLRGLFDDGANHSKSAAKIVRAAIEAHGGTANFAKAFTGRNTIAIERIFPVETAGTFTVAQVFQWPDKLKQTINETFRGESREMVYVTDGEEGWTQSDGGAPTAASRLVAPVNFPGEALKILVGLTRPSSPMVVLPETEIRGRSAHHVRYEYVAGWVDNVFIDRETQLLLAVKHELVAGPTGKNSTVEKYYSNFKKIDGLTLPMSMELIVDGTENTKFTISDFEFDDKIDAAAFNKPAVRR
jgi:hypothetical protein